MISTSESINSFFQFNKPSLSSNEDFTHEERLTQILLNLPGSADSESIFETQLIHT
jgi:hypothetical protein